MFDTGSDRTREEPASLLIAIFDGLLIQWLLDPDGIPNGPLLTGAIERLAQQASQ